MTLTAQQMLGLALDPARGPADVALAYHARTKHTPERYAAGPETLDWDAQPNPFREFEGCPRTQLPFSADQLAARFAQIHSPGGAPSAALTIASVGALMELSMGLSAWKELGPDRWALRCNPSSGNLHPTEAYVLANNVPGLDDGVHHYVSRDHILELRCRHSVDPATPARLWIALSSVHWREAWKYGERGFRYCQLDIGHALGAISYAAATLGWRAGLVEDIAGSEIAALLGLDRTADFASAEPEDADLLIEIDIAPGTHDCPLRPPSSSGGQWLGHASLLDPHPMYRWPVIEQVGAATAGGAMETPRTPHDLPLQKSADARAAEVILGRRSAQRFDSKFVMEASVFHRLLDSLLVRPAAPWDVWNFAPRLHPIVFVHRVEGLTPGVYAMPRDADAAHMLRKAMRADFEWQTPHGLPAHLPLTRLLAADGRTIAKAINCHQAIAADGCFFVSMVGEFEPVVRSNPWRYRQLHWEAGLLGQVLYLEAEASGLRGTGIGCFFDDALHGLLGLQTRQLQALYHFTVGRPITDARISTSPAYPGRPGFHREEQP